MVVIEEVYEIPASSPLPPGPDAEFDALASLARRTIHAPFGMVTMLTTEHQHLPGAMGPDGPVPGDRLQPAVYSFCHDAVRTGEVLAIPDTRADPRVSGNPAIDEFGIRAYAGAPVFETSGTAVGTLCVVDVEPRQWSPIELELLHDLATAVTAQLRLRQLTAAAAVAEDRERLVGQISERVIGELLSVSMALGACVATAPPTVADALLKSIERVDTALAALRESVYGRG